MDWTPEAITQLRGLWERGDSCSMIGREFGCSRNAVIGKARRLGLSKRKEVTAVKRTPKAARTPIQYRKRSFVPFAADVDLPELRCVEVVPLHLTLMQLERDSCRYPYGGDNGEPITFCGHPRDGESSYCHAHYLLTRNTRPSLNLNEAERWRRRRQGKRTSGAITKAA